MAKKIDGIDIQEIILRAVETETDRIGDPKIDGAVSTLAAVLGDPGTASTFKTLVDAIKNEADKIGALDSNPLLQTVISRLETGYQHVHQQARVYPSMEPGVEVAAGELDNGNWQLTATPVEVVPANTIQKSFDVHWAYVESISANGTYELVLYKGLSGHEVEIARVRFVRLAPQVRQQDVPVQVPVQEPNTRISAALASSAGAESVTISLYYHDYNAV